MINGHLHNSCDAEYFPLIRSNQYMLNAGVAAAIMKALFGDDWEVFDNPKYVPNMTCYRTVLDAFYYEEKKRQE